MASDFGLHFLESSIQGRFATDNVVRDLGVAVHNGHDKSPDGIEWVAGLFNGSGEAGGSGSPARRPRCRAIRSIRRPAPSARRRTCRQTSTRCSPRAPATTTAASNAALGHALSLDAIMKVAGFALSGALAVVGVADADPDTDVELGFFADAGYFVVPKHLEVAARYGNVPTPTNFDERDQEILGALNYYFEQPNFKLMLDGGVITHSGDETATDLQIRTQAQLVF
jgi:hypothetical protein